VEIIPSVVVNLGSSAKLTLIGVYAGLVYVLWLTCFRQTLFSDIRSIMYQEWPFADRVEKLCEEVYLVRELGELQLEEELFARLLFLHRSPETLVRFTRPQARTTRKEYDDDQHLHQQ
jgi:piezo-type mechanosensitive ion channel component 1/2